MPLTDTERELVVLKARVSEARFQLKQADAHYAALHKEASERGTPGKDYAMGFNLARRYMSKVEAALDGRGWDVQVAEHYALEAARKEEEQDA